MTFMPPTITEKGNTEGVPGTSKRSTAGSYLKGRALCLSKEHDILFPQREKVLIKKTTYRGKTTKLIFPNDVTDLMMFQLQSSKDHFRTELIQKFVWKAAENRGASRGGPSLLKGGGRQPHECWGR